jgi:hypothetical protein
VRAEACGDPCRAFAGRFELPQGTWVTSRQDIASRRPHYALVCSCPQPLALGDLGRLHFSALRNLIGGTRLGASQVTAVVRRLDEDDSAGATYPVALRAALVKPYFVRLDEFEVVADTEARP